MSTARYRLTTLAFAVVVLATSLTCDGVREDELWCEEAAARLDKCCTDFDPQAVDCTVTRGGTKGSPVLLSSGLFVGYRK